MSLFNVVPGKGIMFSMFLHLIRAQIIHLVTARMQMVARKQPTTIIQPQPPSGRVVTPDVRLPPSSFSSLVTAIAPANHKAD